MTNIANNAFAGCNTLTNLALETGITYIGLQAFEYRTNLYNVVIPDSVTDIEGLVFFGCYNLTNITIGRGVTRLEVHWAYTSWALKSFTADPMNHTLAV